MEIKRATAVSRSPGLLLLLSIASNAIVRLPFFFQRVEVVVLTVCG